MNKLLSIVVPVYKVEQYIRKCLDSLIVSDELMDQLEVIVVNDGTPDRSAIIAKEYEIKYPQTFRVIDKKNGGHGSAWNRGLAEAQGKYVAFLDSDDWYSTESLASLLAYLETTNVDGVMTKMMTHIFEKDKEIRTNIQCNKEFSSLKSNEVYDTCHFDFNQCGMPMYNFQHLCYKTDKLRNTGVRFMENTSYDDDLVGLAGLLMMDRFVYLDMVLYNYRFGREGQSVGGSYSLKRVNQYYLTAKQLYEFYQSYVVNHQVCENQLRIARKFVAHTTFCLFPHFAMLPKGKSLEMFDQMKKEFGSYSLYRQIMSNADPFFLQSPEKIYDYYYKKRKKGEMIDLFALSPIGKLLRKIKHLFSQA